MLCGQAEFLVMTRSTSKSVHLTWGLGTCLVSKALLL